MTIAIITARGGSTRTPRKNVADVCGKPLVAWSIIQAKCAHQIDDVYLTTDDDEIAGIGNAYGAKVIRRPVLDNGITASVVFLDAMRKIENMGVHPDTLVTLLPTACLRRPDDLDRMIRAHRETGKNVGVACPQKETFIHRNDEPFQDRFQSLPERDWFTAHRAIADKFWNYTKEGGGASVTSWDWYINYAESIPPTDLEIDVKMATAPDTVTEFCFIPIEEWQTYDIDYPADLELVRVLMDHYLIHGDGDQIYRYYKESKHV